MYLQRRSLSPMGDKMEIKNNKKSLKEIADELMKIEGNVRGTILFSNLQFILKRQGKEGLKKVEEKLKELGYPFEFQKIKQLDWYPEALSHLILLICQEIFGWKEEDFFEMGYQAPQLSVVFKFLMKYFVSLKKAFLETPNYWKKHINVGELVPYQLNEKEGFVILQLKDYKFHYLGCVYKKGYFTRLLEYLLPNKKIATTETKCVHRGDSFCEFLIKWQ